MWWLTPRQFAALAERHRLATRRADLRIGVVAAVVANVNRDTKKRPEPFEPEDFFPEGDADEELPELTVDRLKADLIAAGVKIQSRSEANGRN